MPVSVQSGAHKSFTSASTALRAFPSFSWRTSTTTCTFWYPSRIYIFHNLSETTIPRRQLLPSRSVHCHLHSGQSDSWSFAGDGIFMQVPKQIAGRCRSCFLRFRILSHVGFLMFWGSFRRLDSALKRNRIMQAWTLLSHPTHPTPSRCSCVCACQVGWAKEDMNVIVPPHPPHPIPMFMRLRAPSRMNQRRHERWTLLSHPTHPTPSQCSCVCVCYADWAKDMNVIVPPHPLFCAGDLCVCADDPDLCVQMTRICVYRWPASVCTDDPDLCV